MMYLRAAFLSFFLSFSAHAAMPASPTEFLKEFSNGILESANKPSLGQKELQTIVEEQIAPFADFERMTASSVGPAWRQATPEQKKQLNQEFRSLLVRTYSGAVREMKGLRLVVKNLPDTTSEDVVVRSDVHGKGEPLQISYKMTRKDATAEIPWKIYDLNVMGIWLVSTYRSQFATEINARGLDGLIQLLRAKNRT